MAQTKTVPVNSSAKSARISFGIVAAVALSISFVLAMQPHLQGPPCLFRAMFHLPCPGCGLTRSFNALWHGNLSLAFRYHPLGLPLFTLFVACLLLTVLRSLWPAFRPAADRLLGELNRPQAWKWAGILLICVWIVRLTLILAGNRYFLW